LDLGHNNRVFKSRLTCLWVFLEVPKDLHHIGILHDSLDFGIGHCMSHSLLVVAGASMGCGLDKVHSLVPAFVAILRRWIDLQTLVKSIYCFVILLHHLMAGALSCPCSDKQRINLKCLFRVLQTLVRLHQLDEARASVIVDCFVLRVSSETFFELLHCGWEIARLEKGNALFFVLLGDLRVNISLNVELFFKLFTFLH